MLAAGAAYVPVGVEQPARRRDRIRSRRRIRLILGERPVPPDAGARKTRAHRVLSLREAWATTVGRPRHGPVDALAYVIFTSGSTGEPKGVEITHAAAANTVADIARASASVRTTGCFALSALDFDLSVYDIFGLLAAGGVAGAARRRAATRTGAGGRARPPNTT